MDKADENPYVSQLSEVFNSCDTTGTGYLDKEELTELCRKLHLEAQLPVLLQTLLGSDHFARVNFEEFKEGFVAVLSRTIDLSLSEDQTSYLQPVIPEEEKPKFVNGTKRYGRRSRPEVQATNVESSKYLQDQQTKGNRKNQLRRSASLESVESLKSDEEAESAKDPLNETFEAQGQLRSWNPDIFDSPGRASSPCSDMTENQVRDIWEELDVGNNGYLNKLELATVCKNIGLKDLKSEEIEDLFNKLDQDGDGRVSFKEFQLGLFSHGPSSLPISSTPFRQKRQRSLSQAFEESGRTPSLLSSCGGLHLFSSIDDGTGFVNAEQVLNIWEQEGLNDCKEILKTLDFRLEEPVNLSELAVALDKEMATTSSRVHQAGLASYRQELQHLRAQVEQVSKEKDKVKKDCERAELRNRQLTSEVDDHHSVMEHLNQSKISDLEQDYKEKVVAIRSELLRESELFMQQADQQRAKLEADVFAMQREDVHMREKLTLCLKENSRLQKEMLEIVEKAKESKKLAVKLQSDLDIVLNERLRLLDPQSTGHFDQEERFAEIIREYEIQCREVRDRNDELEAELETLRSQLNEYKNHNMHVRRKDLKQLLIKSKINSNLNTDNLAKSKFSQKLWRSSSTVGINGVVSKEIASTALSIEAELTKEQLKEHQQQLQDVRIQLETKVNYYEREIELMKQNFEQERKDTEQEFKMEVSELEEQKSDLEELNAKLEEVISGFKDQLQKSPQSQEIEKRFERERAEMEQNYTKEISKLAQSLTQEREQLEEELKRNHQHELQATRNETEVECNQKLLQAEAQYSEKVKALLHQHQSEMDTLVQTHAEELVKTKERHIQEKKQWGEKEAKIVMDGRKEKLKYEERLHEDQAKIFKTFAIEKEVLENNCRKQIESLNLEVENLKTCLFEAKRDLSKLKSLYVKMDSPPRIPHDKTDSPDLSEDQLSKSQHLSTQEYRNDSIMFSRGESEQTGVKMHLWNDIDKKVDTDLQFKSDLQFKLEQKENLLRDQSKQMEDKSCQETKNSIEAQLRLKEVLLPGEESSLNLQLSTQLHAKEKQLKMLKNKVEDLISELEQSSHRTNVQESKLKELAKERDILFEQERHSREDLELLRVSNKELLKQHSLCEIAQKEKDVINTETRDMLEYCNREKEEQSKQIKNLEEELSSRRRSEENALEKLKLHEEEVAICLHQAHREFEEEKIELKDKLLDLEHLVYRLETETGLDDRIELNRLSEDNGVLRNKIQQYEHEVGTATAEVAKERENSEKLQSEIIALSKQIKTLEDEIGQLTTKNLQLSDIIKDLCAKAQDSDNTIQHLNAKLAEIARQKENESAVAMKLQETVASLEKKQLQQESTWLQESGRTAQEMNRSKETVANLTFQHELLQQEKEELRQEAEDHKNQMATLTFQHQVIQQEKEGLLKKTEKQEERLHGLEAELQRVNQEFQTLREKEGKMQIELVEFQDQVTQVSRLEAELQSVNQACQTLRLKDAQMQDKLVASHDQVKDMHVLKAELQRVNLECQALRQKEEQIREELLGSQDQLLEAKTRLTLAESQHMREVHELKEKVLSAVPKDHLDKLQAKLQEAQEKIHQLQDRLRLQAEQANRQLVQQQDEHERLLRRMEEKMLEVEINLKTVRLMLQEKVKQLKEQLEKNAKSDLLLKDLYVENAQLMKALQVTEQRQKTAEKKNFILDEKIAALNKLVRNIAPASLSA